MRSIKFVRIKEIALKFLVRYAFLSINYAHRWRFRHSGIDHLAGKFADTVDLGDRQSNAGKCADCIGDRVVAGANWGIWVLLLLVAEAGSEKAETEIASSSFSREVGGGTGEFAGCSATDDADSG